MTQEALKLAFWALTYIYSKTTADEDELIEQAITAIKKALAQEKALQALHDENERLGLYKDAYAEPEEKKLHPVHIGVDVTREGTAVTAFYRKPDAVMEMFYSQFHPLAQQEQEPVGKLQEPAAERAWFTIAELNAWADKKLSENPHWVMPKDEPEREEALAQTQEPVAYLCENAVGHKYFRWKKPSSTYKPIALYTTPPQRTEQEPVAWRVSPRYEDSDGYFDFTDSKDTADTLQKRGWTITPLYTTPPQRTCEG